MRQRKVTKKPEYMVLGTLHNGQMVALMTSTDSGRLLKILDDTAQDNLRSQFYTELTVVLKMECIQYSGGSDVIKSPKNS